NPGSGLGEPSWGGGGAPSLRRPNRVQGASLGRDQGAPGRTRFGGLGCGLQPVKQDFTSGGQTGGGGSVVRGNTPDRRWGADGLRVCLIVEQGYGPTSLPLAVGDRLRSQGHSVTVLEPHSTATRTSGLIACSS